MGHGYQSNTVSVSTGSGAREAIVALHVLIQLCRNTSKDVCLRVIDVVKALNRSIMTACVKIRNSASKKLKTFK